MSSSTPSQDVPSEDLEAPSEGRRAPGAYAEDIVDTIRESLLVLDTDLRVRFANAAFYETFEVEPEDTEGRLVYDLGNGQWDIPELRELLEEVLPHNDVFNGFEITHTFESIGERTMLLNARRLDHRQLILLAIEDATERKAAEAQLRQSEERYRLLVESAEEYAIFMVDRENHIASWNAGAERIFGYSEEEAIGQLGHIIFTEEQRAAGIPEQEMETAAEEGQATDERWHVRQDGSRFWGSGVMTALYGEDGALQGFAKVMRDNTERKKAREELARMNETLEERVERRTEQVRELSSRLTMAEQQERRRIAQILHDDLQQRLYGVGMKMAFFRRHVLSGGSQEQLLEQIQQAEAWLDEAVETARDLSVDLSPPVLGSDSLADVLSWLKTQMKERHDLKVEIEATREFYLPGEDLRTLLFQVVRELLFNVVKHAGVGRATVELTKADGYLGIHVVDEGRGFDMSAAQEEDQAGFGLAAARERLELFGGRLKLESAPGEGTRATALVPLEAAQQAPSREDEASSDE